MRTNKIEDKNESSRRIVESIDEYLLHNSYRTLKKNSGLSDSKLKRYMSGCIPRSHRDQENLALALGKPRDYFKVNEINSSSEEYFVNPEYQETFERVYNLAKDVWELSREDKELYCHFMNKFQKHSDVEVLVIEKRKNGIC